MIFAALSKPHHDTPFALSLQVAERWRHLFAQGHAGVPCQQADAYEPPYLAAARAGDSAALALFYEEYRPDVWRLLRRFLRSEADAEDALQNTFVKAFAALPRFRGAASLKTWLFRIAVNEATTLLRRMAGRDAGEVPDDLPAPAGVAVAERIAVRALLASLSPDHRAVLILRYWEELSYEEIGVVLSRPLPVVKMRLHRAKAAFRALYLEEPR